MPAPAKERSLWPGAGSGFGPLPPLLVVMTVVTGDVDAVSYLALGHVFVANMTGNVVSWGSLAVPDLTTTVLTLTGVAADSTTPAESGRAATSAGV